MPRVTLEQVRGLGDFATTYQWNLNFIKFPTGVPMAGRFPGRQDLNKRCLSTTLPKKSNSRLTANIRGYQVHQTGTPQYSEGIQLEFVETVDNTISLFLLAWSELCSRTGTQIQAGKESLEAQVQVERLDREDNPIWLYVLYGCQLVDYDHSELDSGNNLIRPKLTLSYDYFEEQPQGSFLS